MSLLPTPSPSPTPGAFACAMASVCLPFHSLALVQTSSPHPPAQTCTWGVRFEKAPTLLLSVSPLTLHLSLHFAWSLASLVAHCKLKSYWRHGGALATAGVEGGSRRAAGSTGRFLLPAGVSSSSAASARCTWGGVFIPEAVQSARDGSAI